MDETYFEYGQRIYMALLSCVLPPTQAVRCLDRKFAEAAANYINEQIILVCKRDKLLKRALNKYLATSTK